MNLIDLAELHAAARGEELPLPSLLLSEIPEPKPKRQNKLAEFRREPEPVVYETVHVVRLWPGTERP